MHPPQPVLVDLRLLFPPTRQRWGTSTPIGVRSTGLKIRPDVPGELIEWWLTSVGDWVGLVNCSVEFGDGHTVDLQLPVPAAALNPLKGNGDDRAVPHR